MRRTRGLLLGDSGYAKLTANIRGNMHGYGGLAWGVVGPVEVVLLFQRSSTSSGLTPRTSPQPNSHSLDSASVLFIRHFSRKIITRIYHFTVSLHKNTIFQLILKILL